MDENPYNARVKRRFLQFSLRGLLGFSALVCLALGGWHWLDTYGSYMEVGDLAVGKPILVKGRVIHLFGPQRCWIQVSANHFPDNGLHHSGWVDRSWLCCYEFEFDLGVLYAPGGWIISSAEVDRRPSRNSIVELQTKGFNVTGKPSVERP